MQATPSTWRLLLDAGWAGSHDVQGAVRWRGAGARPGRGAAAALRHRCGTSTGRPKPPCGRPARASSRRRRAGCRTSTSAGRSPTPACGSSTRTANSVRSASPGEICIGGDGVTLGYLDRPELTAERFVADRFADAREHAESAIRSAAVPHRRPRPLAPRWQPRTPRTPRPPGQGARLPHRTGRDRGQPRRARRHRARAGDRARGPAQRPAAGRLRRRQRPARASTKRRCARTCATCCLPTWCRSTSWCSTRLPLLPERQDRPERAAAAGRDGAKAAPSPAHATDAAAVDPRVRYLSEVWSELLGMPAGADDNFFELGGHSMLAVQMASRVERDTGVRIKLIRLGAETLAQVAAELPVRRRRPLRRRVSADASATGCGACSGWLRGRVHERRRPGCRRCRLRGRSRDEHRGLGTILAGSTFAPAVRGACTVRPVAGVDWRGAGAAAVA